MPMRKDLRMEEAVTTVDWDAFSRINRNRRAIRDFDGRALDETTVTSILSAALLAPSSGNLQPYQFHLVRTPDVKAKVAQACNQQRAAMTASALVVITSSLKIARASLDWQLGTLQGSDLPAKSRKYHEGVHKTLRGFLRIAPHAILDPLRWLIAIFAPALSLLPFGASGFKQWAARNSMPAAQALMLAATAHGLDSCPMEGFSALKVSRLLGLPRGTVIPIVVALGYRSEDALVEPQMRRDLRDVLVMH
jgi:nitroreductase